MKKQLLTFLLATSATILLAFGDTETRNVSSFSELSVSSGISATLVKGSTNKIELEVEGIDLDKVTTEVNGDRLTLKIKQNWFGGGWGRNRKVTAVITYSEALDYISSSSGSSVKSDEEVRTSSAVEVKSSSGASCTLNMNTNQITVDVSSGATMSLKGETSELEVDVSSGSSFKGFDLKSKNVNVDVSSGASARVYVDGKLNADVSSGGSVKYKGSPTSKDIDKSSGGSVTEA